MTKEEATINALLAHEEALMQEPRKGHWILTVEDWNRWECSECGYTKRTDIHVGLGYNYCPNCGIKMESEDKR